MKRFVSIRRWHWESWSLFCVALGFLMGIFNGHAVPFGILVVGLFGVIFILVWRQIVNRDKELLEKNGNPRHFWWDGE